jgi:hypothetical protein
MRKKAIVNVAAYRLDYIVLCGVRRGFEVRRCDHSVKTTLWESPRHPHRHVVVKAKQLLGCAGLVFVCAWVAVFLTPLAQAAPALATPHDATTIQQIEANPDPWVGRLLAFHGKIAQVEKTSKGKVSLRLLLADPNPGTTHVWAMPLGSGGLDRLEVGDELLMLGHLAKVRGEELPEEGIEGYPPFHLLAICLVNRTKGEAIYLRAAEDRCHAWESGELDELEDNQ